MAIIQISKNDPVQVGDELIFVYALVGPAWAIIQAAQIKLIEDYFKKKGTDTRYQVLSYQITGDNNLRVKVKIMAPYNQAGQVQQASVVSAAVWATLVIGGGIFLWLSLKEVYKISEDVGPAAKTGFALSAAAAIFLIIMIFLRK